MVESLSVSNAGEVRKCIGRADGPVPAHKFMMNGGCGHWRHHILFTPGQGTEKCTYEIKVFEFPSPAIHPRGCPPVLTAAEDIAGLFGRVGEREIERKT